MSAELVQGSPEWLEMRKNFIGASDSVVVMGCSPWKTRFRLWQEKVGLVDPEPANVYMKRGIEMEPEARAWFEEQMNCSVKPTVVFHKEHSFMMASLDGISSDGEVCCEIKVPGSKDHELASIGEVPDKYYPQLQHQLACTGLNQIHYISYDGFNNHVIVVERDNEYINILIEKEKEFWRMVTELEAPELCDKDFVNRGDEAWITAVDEYRQAKAILQAAEAVENECRNALIALAGNNNVQGAGIKLTKVIRRGAVEYSKIPELKHVNLEKFRKGPTESWRISMNKD